jgi:hypothetical protein
MLSNRAIQESEGSTGSFFYHGPLHCHIVGPTTYVYVVCSDLSGWLNTSFQAGGGALRYSTPRQAACSQLLLLAGSC